MAMKKHGEEKIHKVMGEFKKGDLKSSSGDKVTNRKQAVAIAMSESGMSRKHKGDMPHHSPDSPPGMVGMMVKHGEGPMSKGMEMHDPKKDPMISRCMKECGMKGEK